MSHPRPRLGWSDRSLALARTERRRRQGREAQAHDSGARVTTLPTKTPKNLSRKCGSSNSAVRSARGA